MIFFLDFDGVLHHENVRLTRCAPSSRRWLKDHERKYLTHTGYLVKGANLFEHVARLEAALAPFPDVQIVITSTWRAHFHIEDLKQFLPTSLAARVIGVTPTVFSRDGVCQRTREIERYLRENEIEDAEWLAIDDTDFLFCGGSDNPHVFLVDGATGFTAEYATELVRRLEIMRQCQGIVTRKPMTPMDAVTVAANVSYRDGPTRAELEKIFLSGELPPQFIAHVHRVLTEMSWRIIEDAAKQISDDHDTVLENLKKIGVDLES